MQAWISTNSKGNSDRHEYDIELVDQAIRMRYSNAGHWTYPTRPCAHLDDDGDGLTITIEDQTIRLGYADAEKLLILLALNNDSKIKITEQKLIKEL